MMRLAVLADPHLHDTRWTGPPGLVRTLADTAASTRVFNESLPAFAQALSMIAAERIPLAVILGDLTDDGQPANWAAARALLADHTRRFGTRFFWLPGNHDQWAAGGLPLLRDRLLPDGRVETLAGPGAAVPGATADPGLRMVGMAEAMAAARGLGQAPQADFLLWETPFGASPAASARIPPGSTVPDASVLVEPAEGLWLLLLDANVWCEDGRGGHLDQSRAGWAAVLAQKAWLLDWMADVAGRARRRGKHLLAFSHYPVSDPFRGVTRRIALPGTKQRRVPTETEAARIAATGIGHHFSGHWHAAARSADPAGRLLNIAVPSTVAFPAGFVVAEIAEGRVSVTERRLAAMPGQDRWQAGYRAELRHRPDRRLAALASADSYPGFLAAHLRHVVLTRRLGEDWPAELAGLAAEVTLADLGGSALPPALARLPLTEMLVDWYRLREAGGGAMAGVAPDRRTAYAALRPGGPAALDSFAATLSTLARPMDMACA